MQISLILYLVLYAFNCIILNICVIELSKPINQSISFTSVVVIFSFTYRLLIISQSTNCMIHPFYINVFLSLSVLYSFLVNAGCFHFYEGLCGWKNSNQNVSLWKQAVGLDTAAITKQVTSYSQRNGRISESGC